MFDVFVISPYTHENPDIMRDRVNEAEKYIAKLTMEGVVAYSTIAAMDHLVRKFELPNDFEYWKTHCIKMVSAAKEVHVLCLDGWEDSVGAQYEIEVAIQQTKKINYITPE
jgi:hypothetical protein